MRMRTSAVLLFSLPLASAFVPPSLPRTTGAAASKRSSCVTRMSAGSTLSDEMISAREVLTQYEENRQRRLREEEEEMGEFEATRQKSQSFTNVRRLTEGPSYMALEALMVASVAVLFDAAWSGDWTSNGLISYDLQENLQTATIGGVIAHTVLAGMSYALTTKKQREGAVVNGLRTLLIGGLDFFRVAVMEDRTEQEFSQAQATPPLQMEISTFQMEQATSLNGVLLSTSIRVRPGKHVLMSNLLKKLVDDAMVLDGGVVSTMAVNQDHEDIRNFFMLQRFHSQQKMAAYQNTLSFKNFVKAAEPLLSEPLGLYITNERMGRLTEPRYPFGPGGEGGRDDAIFSSPTNLDGSQNRHREEE